MALSESETEWLRKLGEQFFKTGRNAYDASELRSDISNGQIRKELYDLRSENLLEFSEYMGGTIGNIRLTLNGIIYVSNLLGYPLEKNIQKVLSSLYDKPERYDGAHYSAMVKDGIITEQEREQLLFFLRKIGYIGETPNFPKITDLGRKYLRDIKQKEDFMKIKDLQDELETIIKKQEKGYFRFSVFISHSTADYKDVHPLLLTMIKNGIKPEIWFEEVDEEVCEKLCNKIDHADLFLIYITEHTLTSQMTNNEIGFVEGKKYYKYKEPRPILSIKLMKIDFNVDKLHGFYTRGKDYVRCDLRKNEDIDKIIENLNQKYDALRKNAKEKE